MHGQWRSSTLVVEEWGAEWSCLPLLLGKGSGQNIFFLIFWPQNGLVWCTLSNVLIRLPICKAISTWDHSLVLLTYLVDTGRALQHQPPGRTSCQTSIIGGRAFPVTASQIWNSLPENVVSTSTMWSFQHQLKTFLFELNELSSLQ